MNIFIIVIFLFLFSTVNCCYSQDWDTFLNNYDKNQITNPVTPQEFENAINTVKSIQNKNQKKEKKKKEKKNKKGSELAPPPQSQSQPQPVKEIIEPTTPGMLLRLPVSVIANDKILSDGFYLIDKIYKNKKYYLKILQSGKTLAELETQIAAEKYTGFPQLFINNKGKQLELIYIDREASIKTEIPVYFNSIPAE